MHSQTLFFKKSAHTLSHTYFYLSSLVIFSLYSFLLSSTQTFLYGSKATLFIRLDYRKDWIDAFKKLLLLWWENASKECSKCFLPFRLNYIFDIALDYHSVELMHHKQPTMRHRFDQEINLSRSRSQRKKPAWNHLQETLFIFAWFFYVVL